MSAIRRRVEKLEGSGAGGSSARSCPECGVPLWGPIEFIVVPDDGEPPKECSGCGRVWPFTFAIERAAPGEPGLEEGGG